MGRQSECPIRITDTFPYKHSLVLASASSALSHTNLHPLRLPFLQPSFLLNASMDRAK
ncbi:hypothetical protein EVA_01188 [gut metagenome]|uniref:Uncharacterized protein n=1 Tax=gut metagenome TaxID=749906 RepID=J9DC00_9ZZZZ